VPKEVNGRSKLKLDDKTNRKLENIISKIDREEKQVIGAGASRAEALQGVINNGNAATV
jgi:phosphoribosylcarboxyaminoimidazole (NCAIR) mutase